MNKFMKISVILMVASVLVSCGSSALKVTADMLYFGGPIYTSNHLQPLVEAVATRNGDILAVGTKKQLQQYVSASTVQFNLYGRTMLPGLIEGHGHFISMGARLMQIDLRSVTSYDELVQIVANKAKDYDPGDWIIGFGWHQSKWISNDGFVQGFPTNSLLNAVTPNNPVYLTHASGHAGLANKMAMELAQITQNTADVAGGTIIKNQKGQPTGILNERAEDLMQPLLVKEFKSLQNRALKLAISYSLQNGITSFQDAGTSSAELDVILEGAEQNQLSLRLYLMLSSYESALLQQWYKKGPLIGGYDNYLTIRSIKVNADGALGSRGAWLLKEYSDMKGQFGTLTQPISFIRQIANKGLEYGFQVNTHAIGDRTNREVLDQYQLAIELNPLLSKDHRFRIEHAQHIDPADIPRFAKLGVIPSIQAIHMSSDRRWAINRLGAKRIKDSAYVWRKLINSGSIIVNGTDAPVEPISPIANFYASVTRKTLQGYPEGGFESDEKLTRIEALHSMTINPAFAAFEEHIKGSIEPNKLADFTILSQNIMTIPENKILNTTVVFTIVDGKVVYRQVN